MRLSLPTGRTGRSLALGLPVLVIAMLWLGVAMPLIEWHADRTASLTRQSALANRMEALAVAVPALRQQAASVVASGTGEPALLEGDSDSTASASLQERLQAMFLQAGVQLNSVETVPGEEAGTFRRIRLRLSFNASWPILVALLKDLQLATPMLLVDELQVQPALHRISTAPGTFDVSCSVFAFRSGSAGAGVR
jgi:general secretion pathway protein M